VANCKKDGGTTSSNPLSSVGESVSRREFVIVVKAPRSISAPPVATRRSCWLVHRTHRQGLWSESARDPNQAPTSSSVPKGNSRPNLAPVATPAAPPAAPRPCPVALADRDAKLHEAGIPAAPIVALSRPFEDPVPSDLASEQIDLVTLMFNYHDLGHLGVDRAAMNRAVFRALKPGGLYVIADHAGRPGTGISESGTLHRIEEAFLRQEVEAAGFKLVEEGTFLRNPNDPRDKNTPDPPQPKDEFVLKFVRP